MATIPPDVGEISRVSHCGLCGGLSGHSLVSGSTEYRLLRVWAVWCCGVWLIRGLPNDIDGEPTDFTAVIEPVQSSAIIHLGERIDSFDKVRRLKAILRAIGFESAYAHRKGQIKDYKL